MNKPSAHLEKPAGLIARMLSQKAEPQAKNAEDKLSEAPEVINMTAWYEEHVALLHQMLHLAVKAVAGTLNRRNARLIQQIGETHAALKRQAFEMAGNAVPHVIARDGNYQIPYERLAEARAKVQILIVELGQLREELATVSVEGWRPRFDGLSVRQEALAATYCEEICGGPGKFARRPSKARLLEMARALYEAEREELQSGSPQS